jgi:hypothetical protein
MNLTKILPTMALALMTIPAMAQTTRTTDAKAPARLGNAEPSIIILVQKPSYPLTTDIVTGAALPTKPTEYVKNQKLFRLATPDSIKSIDADPVKYVKILDDAVVAAQKPTYPMTKSPVSDQLLDAGAVDFVHGTRLVRLANIAEIALFQADPHTPMQKLDQAWIASLRPTYAHTLCVVDKKPLGIDPVDYLYGVKLIRFDTKGCVDLFEKDVDTYVAALATLR